MPRSKRRVGAKERKGEKNEWERGFEYTRTEHVVSNRGTEVEGG